MLDPELSKVLNIDPFTQYIMKELDEAEDDVHSENLSHDDSIAKKARYELLLQIRDAYADYINNKNT